MAMVQSFINHLLKIKVAIMWVYVVMLHAAFKMMPQSVILDVAQRKYPRFFISRYLGWRAYFRRWRNLRSYKSGERKCISRWRVIGGFSKMFSFHDEKCVDVLSYNNMRDAWKLAKYGLKYPLHKESDSHFNYLIEELNGESHFYADNLTERWINLISKAPLPKDYALDFVLTPHSIFVEQCQIAFAMKSLSERHRFVVEFNKKAYYQIISDWDFLPVLESKDINFDVDMPLHVRFEKVGNTFTLLLNTNVVLCVQDVLYKSEEAFAALIFWNGWPDKGGCDVMDFKISDFKVEVPCE